MERGRAKQLSQNHIDDARSSLLKVAIDEGFQTESLEGQTSATLLFMQQFKTVAVRLSFT